MAIKMKDLPKTERPYEKLELFGEKTLSNAELLAIIIKTGTKDETATQLAQKILAIDKNANSLRFLEQITIEELMKIKGIGKVKAIQLKAVCEIAKRMSKPFDNKKIIVKQPKDILKEVVKSEMPKMIMIHNHPSGNPTPSSADIELTNRIEKAAKMLGIQLLDHIIIGDGTYESILSKHKS